jgi:hypothetical protein
MSINFFKESPRPPFYYQFFLHSLENEHEIFQILKNLLFIGICSHFNISIFDIHLINDDHIHKISEYFLSLGIKIYFKSFDYEDLHYLYQDFLKDIENVENVDIIKSIDHKTEFIQKITIQSNIDNLEKIKEFNKILDNHFILNFFEKWFTPIKLHDFYIPIEIIKYKEKKKCKCSIIYFDYFNNYSFLDYRV